MRGGASWAALQIVGRNALSLLSTAVLSRILSPSDYGMIGMVATLTALLTAFSDMGLSWATIQRKHLSGTQVSNLFWINAGAGLLLWAACAAAAPAVASFYSEPELRRITVVTGATFFLSGLAVQPFAVMRRRMEFRRVALVELTAIVVGVVAALTAAASNLGYWALVIQVLAAQATPRIGSAADIQVHIRLPRLGAEMGGLLAFGGLMALNSVLIYVSRNFDSVLVGRFSGPTELGYYNRAYFLMLLPSTLAAGVLVDLMVPSLSVLQHDSVRFGSAYRRALRVVAFVGAPVAAGMALTAGETVRIIYGPQWGPVAPLLVWLSVGRISQPIYNTTGWLFTAKGRGKLYLLLTSVNATVLSAAFAIGVNFGALGVAKAYGISMGLVLVGPMLALAHHAAGISIHLVSRALAPVFLSVAAMVVVVLAVAALALALHQVANSFGLEGRGRYQHLCRSCDDVVSGPSVRRHPPAVASVVSPHHRECVYHHMTISEDLRPQRPLLSIVVAAFNVGSFIERCLSSIVSCTDPRFELIVIDDGSTDNTREIAQTFLSNNTRMYAQANGGLGSARNAGLALAKGRYVWFVDGDDFLLPGSIEAVLAALSEQLPEILVVNFVCVDETGHAIEWIPCPFSKTEVTTTGTALFSIHYATTYAFVYVTSRHIFIDHDLRFQPRINMQDAELVPKLLFKAGAVLQSGIDGYAYVKRSNSFINSQNASTRSAYFHSVIEVHQRLVAFKKTLSDPLMERALEEKLRAIRMILLMSYIYDRVSLEARRRALVTPEGGESIPFSARQNTDVQTAVAA